MADCIFCKIANREIDSQLEYEDSNVIAFKDLDPQAPVHVLIIPKVHYDSISQMEDENLIGQLFTAGNKIANKFDLTNYRLVINNGPQAGQSVFHVHLHLLGGRIMSWPPG